MGFVEVLNIFNIQLYHGTYSPLLGLIQEDEGSDGGAIVRLDQDLRADCQLFSQHAVPKIFQSCSLALGVCVCQDCVLLHFFHLFDHPSHVLILQVDDGPVEVVDGHLQRRSDHDVKLAVCLFHKLLYLSKFKSTEIEFGQSSPYSYELN